METTSEANHKWHYWLLSSLILAAIPVIGYSLAFAYESQYCKFFGIPREFIVIDWTSLIIAIGSFIGYFVLVLATLWAPMLLNLLGIRIPGLITRRIFRHAAVILYISLLVVRYHSTNRFMLFLFIIPAYFMFFDFIWPLITQRKIHAYRKKLVKQDKLDSKKSFTLPDFLSKYMPTIILIAVALSLLYVVAFFEGKRAAAIKEEFLIPSTYSQSVVLKTYRDYLICAQLNSDNKSIETEYFFIKLGDDPNLKLTSQKLGPLKVN